MTADQQALLAERLELALHAIGAAPAIAELARTLFEVHDPRLGAECVAAAGDGRTDELELYAAVAAARANASGGERYRLALARFRRLQPSLARRPAHAAGSADAVLDARAESLTAHVVDESMGDSIKRLIADTGGHVATFIEQQLDVSGPNALLRDGVVKRWFLPDGTAIASKRPNPQKPGRFRNELRNATVIAERVASHPGSLTVDVCTPFAVLGDGGHSYALTVWCTGRTLEEFLLSDRGAAERAALLATYRRLLDMLYEAGVLWNDMSPRNVLVEPCQPETVLHILDFEKATVRPVPIDLEERIAHCRGQIAVEELAVLCDRDEVECCLEGYFEPTSWNLDDSSAPNFPQRPDLAAVLAGRGVAAVAAGDYNRLDLDVLAVRQPRPDPSGRRHHLGHIGFKVEQYLSCAGEGRASDYDRKVTEILIAGLRHGCLDATSAVLTRAADRLETAALIIDFEARLRYDRAAFARELKRPAAEAMALIDRLYERRDAGRSLREAAGLEAAEAIA